MYRKSLITLVALPAIALFLIVSCTHDPFLDEGGTNPNDPSDPGSDPENVCDPDSVYFQLQVLPILRSNCAISGCHDAATAKEGIILDSYYNVMRTGDVRAFNPGNSEIYEKIVEDRSDKRMPPPPQAPLNADQIGLIRKWIQQGALNLTCDADAGVCNTANVSFATTVRPIIQNNCQGCHSGGAPSGGIDLSTYAGIKAVAGNGRLYGAISWQPGFSKMPQGGAQLASCSIQQIKSWIDAGAPEN